MCEGNKTQFLSSKSYPSKGTGLTQLKQLRAQDSGSWNLKEKGSHAEVPENTRFLPQGEKKVKKKKKKSYGHLRYSCQRSHFHFTFGC